MQHTEILKNAINKISNCYEKEMILSWSFIDDDIKSFDTEINEMVDSVFDLIGVPKEQNLDKCKKRKWIRDVCTNLIQIAAKNEKYVEPAVELISDWGNLYDYKSIIETKNTWSYYDLLDYKIRLQEQCDK